MVTGGYYKLLVKNTESEYTVEPVAVSTSRCHRLNRWKIYSLFSLLTIVLVVFAFNLLYPATEPSSNKLAAGTVAPTELKPASKDDKSRIRYKHTRRHLPTCIIIGARKAGTRALLTYLNLHPQIIAAKQEIHFFDDNYERGIEWYRKSMPYAFDEQITIEKTPAYFVNEDVPARVYKLNKSMRLLLIVRDPVERAISDYNQIMIKKRERNKPIASFEDLVIKSNGDVNGSYNGIKRSIYAHHMAKWLKYFPLEQFHIVDGEGLVDDPLPKVQAVENFLKIDHRITKENFYFNETRGFYCIRNETMEKCLNPSKGRVHPYVKQEVIHKLRRFFRPYNDKFYEMIHRNFGWP